jgi:hypothetical protein
LGLLSRRWASSGVLPSVVMQHQLEELFLELNREIVTLLRKYVGRGWAATGPLPSTEVFTLEVAEDLWSTVDTHSEFWRALNLTQIPELSYADGQGLVIVPPDLIDKSSFSAPFRVVVKTREYLATKRTGNYASPEDALFFDMREDVLRPMVSLLALREAARRSVDALATLRGQVTPHLMRGQGFMAWLRSAIGLLFIPPRLNALQFQSARMSGACTKHVLGRQATLPFARRTRGKTAERRLTDDLACEVKVLQGHLREQVTLVRSAYRDLWSFAIQWILVILTVVATVIAVAQLSPRKEKAEAPTPASVTRSSGSEAASPGPAAADGGR